MFFSLQIPDPRESQQLELAPSLSWNLNFQKVPSKVKLKVELFQIFKQAQDSWNSVGHLGH